MEYSFYDSLREYELPEVGRPIDSIHRKNPCMISCVAIWEDVLEGIKKLRVERLRRERECPN